MWLLLWVVGWTSTYFHATLSLLGQLLDEISVLWVLMAGMAFWFPEQLIPAVLKSKTKDMSGRKKFVFAVSCIFFGGWGGGQFVASVILRRNASLRCNVLRKL